MKFVFLFRALALASAGTLPAISAEKQSWDSFVETNFPFFSSVLDARKLGAGWPANNLTPRGLILNLGHGCWACFDTDLLRIAAIWSGSAEVPLAPVSMSQGSYHAAGVKASEGQKKLPVPMGNIWLANGIYPGWQTGQMLSLIDSACAQLRCVRSGSRPA